MGFDKVAAICPDFNEWMNEFITQILQAKEHFYVINGNNKRNFKSLDKNWFLPRLHNLTYWLNDIVTIVAKSELTL